MPGSEVTAASMKRKCLADVNLITPSKFNYATIPSLELIDTNCELMKVAQVCGRICKLRQDMYAHKPTVEECRELPGMFRYECELRATDKIKWSQALMI